MADQPGPVCFKDCQNAPDDALKLGDQDDFGDLYVAIAKSEWGQIPGKAAGNTCWFPYNGKEEATNDFYWVTCCRHYKLVKHDKDKSKPPRLAVLAGYQPDCGYLYPAIANTKEGKIPGKAKGGNCWYAYGGEEHLTDDFYWIVLDESDCC